VTAPLAAQVLDEWRQNKAPEDVQERLTPLRTAFAPLPTIPALKYLLSQRRDAPDWAAVRPPLLPLDEDEKRSVDDIEDRLQETVAFSPLHD
jgi:4-hydroxy-tetrahydrodipicolinate synthase